MNETEVQAQLDKIDQAMAVQEGLRGVVAEEEIEAALSQLRQKRAELAVQLTQAQRATSQAKVSGGRAIIHAHRGRLPDSRVLLYEETIDLLLGRWEETKVEDELPTLGQLLQQANRANIDLKRRLGELAYEVHIQAGSGADDEKMADIGEAYLSAELSKLHKKDMGWGQALLEVIKTRAGLLELRDAINKMPLSSPQGLRYVKAWLGELFSFSIRAG